MFGEPGAEIMYPDPGFPIYYSDDRVHRRHAGADPDPRGLWLSFSAEETPSLITPRTRLIILNSPANPTGGVMPKEEFDKLVAGLEKWPDVAILSDEIYDRILYDGEKHVTLLSYPEIRDRLIILNGWSKTYAMTGWRLGYAIWPGKLFDLARKLAVNFHSCVNAPTQYAGIAALTGPQDCVDLMVREFDKRRKLVVEGLNNLPGVSCIMPKGAFYAFPNVSKTGWKAKKLANAILDEAGVAMVGGPDFGMLGEGYLRVSYANSAENITRALERMGRFLSRTRRLKHQCHGPRMRATRRPTLLGSGLSLARTFCRLLSVRCFPPGHACICGRVTALVLPGKLETQPQRRPERPVMLQGVFPRHGPAAGAVLLGIDQGPGPATRATRL